MSVCLSVCLSACCLYVCMSCMYVSDSTQICIYIYIDVDVYIHTGTYIYICARNPCSIFQATIVGSSTHRRTGSTQFLNSRRLATCRSQTHLNSAVTNMEFVVEEESGVTPPKLNQQEFKPQFDSLTLQPVACNCHGACCLTSDTAASADATGGGIARQFTCQIARDTPLNLWAPKP